MNTFWLKVAGIAVLVLIIIVVIGIFSGEDKPKEPQRTIYDQWEEDEEKLTAEPQFKEPPTEQQPTSPATPRRTIEADKPIKSQFEKLSMEEDVEAQRLWQWVLNQRKMGRLPILGYKKMVDTCRDIIRRWPQSEYAFYAKRALADLNEQQKKRYNITDEETDLGNFR